MTDWRTLVVFLVMCTVWALVHVYVVRRFRAMVSPRVRSAFAGAGAVGFALAPASMVLARLDLDADLHEVFSRIAFYEAGLVAIVVVLSVARDLGVLPARLVQRLRGAAVDPSRRRFMEKITNVGVLSVSAMIAGTGAVAAFRAPEIVRQRVHVRGLPRELEGYRIAQLSDVHVGPAYRREGMDAVVRMVNALEADLIAITGDLVDGFVGELADHVAPLAELSAPDGVCFVTGNHEYYWDALAWTEHLRGLGLRTLQNEHFVIERGAARLLVAGCTDHRMGSSVRGHESTPSGALRGAPEHHARVLLAHQPRSVFEAAEAGYDLQLSGHTHGGQFFPFTLFVHLVQPFVRGLSRHGATQIYVNRGTGFWGPAMRHGGPGEITLVTLHREPGSAIA
jgi:uncharacterized protein